MWCHLRLLLLRATTVTVSSVTSWRSHCVETCHKMPVAKVGPLPPVAIEVFCSSAGTMQSYISDRLLRFTVELWAWHYTTAISRITVCDMTVYNIVYNYYPNESQILLLFHYFSILSMILNDRLTWYMMILKNFKLYGSVTLFQSK
jgi:hypothetical protein